MTIWQIAAGDSGGRDYTRLFLEHDVMLIGPGDPGEYRAHREAYRGEQMGKQIAAFCEKPQAGDIVLLRYGKEVVAVGKIPDPDPGYQWNPCFDDVLGWDLQHMRRVLWDTSAVSVLAPIQPVFGHYKKQPTFTAVHEPRIVRYRDDLARAIQDRPLHSLPTGVGKVLSPDELGMALFSKGLSNDAVEKVLATIARIKRLDDWYRRSANSGRPSEHEIVAHMIAPLMLGMGWSEQLLAIEWNQIDMAFFCATPTTLENCVMICEAKRQNQSLESAYEQALAYLTKKNVKNCRRIVTTDGARLLLYRRDENGSWPDAKAPSGCVNVRRIRDQNVFPKGTSGVETLMELVPWKAMSG